VLPGDQHHSRLGKCILHEFPSHLLSRVSD
jgi:hypothetical protein